MHVRMVLRAQVLLTMLGFPAAMLLPIPAHLGVEYREILKNIKAVKKDGSAGTAPSSKEPAKKK